MAIALSGVYDLSPLPHTFLQDEIPLTGTEIAAHKLRPSEARKPVLYVNGAGETPEFLRGPDLMGGDRRSPWELLYSANHTTLLWAAMLKMPRRVTLFIELEAE